MCTVSLEFDADVLILLKVFGAVFSFKFFFNIICD